MDRMTRGPGWRAGMLGGLAALAALVGAGCEGEASGVGVEVVYAAESGARAPALTDVTVIVGRDRHAWPTLPPAGSRRVTMAPGPGDDAQATLLFRLDGAEHAWRGPDLPPGTGYELRLRIGADGRVDPRHCVRPCRLPEAG